MTPHTLSLEIEDHCDSTVTEEDWCEYIWDCDTVWVVTSEWFMEVDTDMNGQIS
jgi:hypothetical protein